MNGSNHRTYRLSAYSALAGSVIPAAAASAALVGQSGLSIVVDSSSSPVALDFGPGYGELFSFNVNTGTLFSTSEPSRAVGGAFFSSTSVNIQFNALNSGGWSDASIVRYYGLNQSRWPDRLTSDSLISSDANWIRMNQEGPNEHVLAARQFSSSSESFRVGSGPYSYSYVGGQFANDRGFLGLRIFDSGGETDLFLWIDVEVELRSIGERFLPELTIQAWGLDDSGAPIQAGVPTPGAAALACLALGAAGIRRSRRDPVESSKPRS